MHTLVMIPHQQLQQTCLNTGYHAPGNTGTREIHTLTCITTGSAPSANALPLLECSNRYIVHPAAAGAEITAGTKND